MSCSYVPPLVEQLHGPDPTAGSDCAIACACMAIRFATCDDVNPGIDRVREMAGLDHPDPPGDWSTTMTEYTMALNSFDARAREAGYDGIGAGKHERESWADQLAPLIREAVKWATIFVDYGTVNRLEPDKTGDKGFTGAHAVSAFGFTPAEASGNGKPRVKIFDPLNDGRRPEIPKGPVWWNMETLKQAADDYAGGGSGTATWCATPRSRLLEPPPGEAPPDPCAQTARTSDLSALLEEAREHFRSLPTHEARELARWIRQVQGDNPEGLALPVHSGVTPDQG